MRISILVSGECRENTELIIKKINEYNVFDQKIISTWDINKIDRKLLRDWVVVICNDPGRINKFSDKASNIIRAAKLNYEGSQKILSENAIKIRSDFLPTKKFIEKLDKKLLDINADNIYIDTVGTTNEWMHYSDFVLLSKSEFLCQYFKNIYELLMDDQASNLLENYCKKNKIQFRRKKYNEVIPAESVNFIFGYFGKNFIEKINFNQEINIRIKFFKINDFNRGARLDPVLGFKAAYRFLRGKVKRNSLLDRFLNELY